MSKTQPQIEINQLDLFSGCGGFALGLEQAGFKIKNHYFSEIDKNAIANYKHNFKKAQYVGSVEDVRGIQADIITFGSPCQDFSLAGKRKGMDGSRSSLILEAIRIIGESRPSVFIWENVKGTFSSNGGADFWAILSAFANIGGYRLEWQLLNTSWFLPQNRERIYLVGHLDGKSKPGVFPFREINGKINGIPGQQANTNTILQRYGNDAQGSYVIEREQHAQITPLREVRTDEAKEERSKTGSNKFRGKKIEPRPDQNTGAILGSPTADNSIMITSNTSKGYDIATEQDSINLSVPTSKTRRGRVGKGKAQTIDTQANQGVLVTGGLQKNAGNLLNKSTSLTSAMGEGGGHIPIINQIRRLTEIECERLQGFPDDWTKWGVFDSETKEISRSQRYKMCGNAVTVDVVKAIGERLIKQMI